MKTYSLEGHKYLVSESQQEDRILCELAEDRGWDINYTPSPLVLPHIDGWGFFSTLGNERGALDDWKLQDIKLYRKLLSMPQHFKVVFGVCLTRESMHKTDLASVYIKQGVQDNCGCEYCTKGMVGILAETGHTDAEY